MSFPSFLFYYVATLLSFIFPVFFFLPSGGLWHLDLSDGPKGVKELFRPPLEPQQRRQLELELEQRRQQQQQQQLQRWRQQQHEQQQQQQGMITGQAAVEAEEAAAAAAATATAAGMMMETVEMETEDEEFRVGECLFGLKWLSLRKCPGVGIDLIGAACLRW
jgi:hypothetical protein